MSRCSGRQRHSESGSSDTLGSNDSWIQQLASPLRSTCTQAAAARGHARCTALRVAWCARLSAPRVGCIERSIAHPAWCMGHAHKAGQARDNVRATACQMPSRRPGCISPGHRCAATLLCRAACMPNAQTNAARPLHDAPACSSPERCAAAVGLQSAPAWAPAASSTSSVRTGQPMDSLAGLAISPKCCSQPRW